MLGGARNTALQADAPLNDRETAIRLLGRAPFDSVRETLTALVDSRQPEPVQLAAVRALAGYPHTDIGPILLGGWRGQSPAVRQAVTQELLASADGIRHFLRAVEAGAVSANHVELAHRDRLLKDKDPAIRELAQRLLGGDAPGARSDVLADYRTALTLAGDTARGEQVFRRECMACHKLGDTGHAVGPDLASSPAADAESLLVHVLDPNRYVLPTYEQYLVVDVNGRIFTGLIAAQTATSVTLRRDQDHTDTILRIGIDELTATGKSLMPEGLEQKIDKQAMSDLIAYIQAAARQARRGEPPLPIGTLPGLIEPD
jgi:putative heme-binding domain-containing protein